MAVITEDVAPAAQTSHQAPDSSDRPHAGGGQSGIGADTRSQQLLQQILQTLKESSIAQQSGNNPKSRFWATYKREAEDYDSDFLEKYKDDMDIVLIFSGLFSAVSSTFITSMQSSLSADPTATTNVLLMQLIRTANTTAFSGQNLDLPAWDGPGLTIIWVQSLIYASLSASLLAALGAVLGKQWLGHYRRRGLGTVDERAIRRQQKLNGLEAWHFHSVLEVLPVLLQISLLFFGVALSAFVWTQQSAIGAVVIGTMTFGILFYISITVASLISPDCPFHTPPSTIITITREAFRRPLLHYFRGEARSTWGKGEAAAAIVLLPAVFAYQYFRHFRRFLVARHTNFQVRPFWRAVTHRGAQANFESKDLESSATSMPPQTPLKLEIPFPSAHKFEAPAITWLIETSTDPEVIATAARMVPGVEWPVELDISPAYLQLCNTFVGCFVSVTNTSEEWQLAPMGQERALACGKALVHLYCNRLYLEFKLRHGFCDPRLASLFACLQRDCSDQNTAVVCDIGFFLFSRQGNQFPRVPDTSRIWVSHLLPHLLSTLVWDKSVRQRAVEVIIGLVTRPFPPRRILADCLLSAAIVMGIEVDMKELVKIDKGSVAEMLLQRILQMLPTACRITEARMSVKSKLLQPLSLCFDAGIKLGFGPCESKGCGCEVMEWGLHTCQSLAGKLWSTSEPSGPDGATSKEERSEMWRTARAALHLSASVACCGLDDFGYPRTRWRPSYGGHRGRPVIDGPDWVIRFLDEHYDAHDSVAVADTFTMLSQARNIHQWADSPAFVGAIIRAMGPDQPTQVRHTALRAAWEIKNASGFPKDAIRSMLPDFFVAIHSAVMTNLDPPDNTTNEDSPDRFVYRERDLCYLQIIYTLVQNFDGVYDDHLRDPRHFHRCLDIAKHTSGRIEILSVYLIAIVETLEARNTERGFLDAFAADLRSTHHKSAWFSLFKLPVHRIQEHEQALSTVTAFTCRCRETKANNAPRDFIQRVHDKLEPDSPAIGSLAELLASWPESEHW